MRPFFIVIMTGPIELSANTTDLYSGSPLRREQVCVYVCELDLVVWVHRLLLHYVLRRSRNNSSVCPGEQRSPVISAHRHYHHCQRCFLHDSPLQLHTTQESHKHTQGLLFCRSTPCPRSVDSLAGGVNNRNRREY